MYTQTISDKIVQTVWGTSNCQLMQSSLKKSIYLKEKQVKV